LHTRAPGHFASPSMAPTLRKKRRKPTAPAAEAEAEPPQAQAAEAIAAPVLRGKKRPRRAADGQSTAASPQTQASAVSEGKRDGVKGKKRAVADARSGLIEPDTGAASLLDLGKREEDGVVETEQSLKADKDRTMSLLGEVLEKAVQHEAPSEDELLPAAKQPKDAAQSRKVFVGGLPWKATPEAVEDFFAKYGEIDSFNMPNHKVTGKPMGVAFIVFARKDAVERALAFDGKTYGGKKLRVKVADPNAKGKGQGQEEAPLEVVAKAAPLGGASQGKRKLGQATKRQEETVTQQRRWPSPQLGRKSPRGHYLPRR